MMKKHSLTVTLSLGLLPLSATAGLLSDSHLTLDSRTMYYKNSSPHSDNQPTGKQAGEALILKGTSGYTPGIVGFGADALGLLGGKIYGPAGHNTNGGLFPQHSDRSAPSTFGSVRFAAKAKISQTSLRAGFQQPNLPVIKSSIDRLFPWVFRGYSVHSEDIPHLTLDSGFIDRVEGRNQTHFQRLKTAGKAAHGSSGFTYAGGQYHPVTSLALSYYYARLNNFYQQHFLGAVTSSPLGPGVITTDTRYFYSRSEGSRYGGDADNNALGGIITYKIAGNSLGIGYQQLTGSGDFPYLDEGQSIDDISTDSSGGDSGLITDSPLVKFNTAHERAWILRYSLDLDRLGARGLRLNTGYIHGNNARSSHSSDKQNEWIRTFGLSYRLPEYISKDMTISWKNVMYRTNLEGKHSQNQNILLLTWHYAVL